MLQRNQLAPLLAVLMVASVAVPGAAAMMNERTAQQSSAYAGTHVEFQTEGSAITSYSVDGVTVADSVRVQSQDSARSDAGVDIGADVSALTGWTGAALSVDATTETQATVTSESGATLAAHDNGHGSLVVSTGGESQYVGMNLSSSASAESESEQRAVVTTSDGSKAAVIATGDGTVAVNDDGNLTAELGADDRLVVRSYDGDRSANDKQQEELITSGAAAAQVYLTENGQDIVDYGQNTAVEVHQQSEGRVEMTVERSASHGKVVITSVSDAAIQNTEDLAVRVDGEAAAEASSYSELKAAADGGGSSMYMVRSTSQADASADVLVGINHFSERSVTMAEQGAQDGGTDDSSSGDATDGDSTSEPGTTGDAGPGFTLIGATLAVLSAVALLGYRAR